jgi:hypothetical protein
MKKGTLISACGIALTIMFSLTLRSSVTFAEGNGSQQANDYDDARRNALVGVWEETTPALADCETGHTFGPIIKALVTFNEGGTMYVEDTFPEAGPYRSTGGGVWKHTSGRNYTYGNLHYEFDPDKTFLFTIKQKSELRLSRDGNSFTERGSFQGIAPDGTVMFDGCFAATATRVRF